MCMYTYVYVYICVCIHMYIYIHVDNTIHMNIPHVYPPSAGDLVGGHGGLQGPDESQEEPQGS